MKMLDALLRPRINPPLLPAEPSSAARVINTPSDPFYGPVRRLWVAVQTLFADHLDRLDDLYMMEWGGWYDLDMVAMLSAAGPGDEAAISREVIQRLQIAIDGA